MKKSKPLLRRLVVKIGTSVLVDENKKISTDKIKAIARQVRAIKAMNIDVIIVSSGAIACGMETVGLTKKPKEIAKRQALASIGQVLLMKMYRENFEKKNMKVGQIL